MRRSPGLVPAPIPDMRLRKSSRNDRSTSPTPLARRSTSPTTLARSQIRFDADSDMRLRSSAARSREESSSPTARSRKESPTRNGQQMVCLCLQNHPECKKSVLTSIGKTCEEHKTNVQRVVTVRSLSKQVHVRDRRELREKMEEIKYGLPRFSRIN